jgi:hypothetical protein
MQLFMYRASAHVLRVDERKSRSAICELVSTFLKGNSTSREYVELKDGVQMLLENKLHSGLYADNGIL